MANVFHEHLYAFIDWAFSHPADFYPRAIVVALVCFLFSIVIILAVVRNGQEEDGPK
jgi:hypothetical protein